MKTADPAFFNLGSFKVRVEHGDYINPNDTTYLRYREFVRTKPLETLAYQVSGRFWNGLGQLASALSRRKSEGRRISNVENFRQMIRDYAVECRRKTVFDFIITGHMHIRDEYEFKTNGGLATSINLGSWYDRPKALVLDDVKHQWLDLV